MEKVVHCKRQPYDVYIGRPSVWGNPYTHIVDKTTAAKYIVSTRDEAVANYRKWIIEGDGQHLLARLDELEGKTLGCWCVRDESKYHKDMKMVCHGEVLLELLANRRKKEEE